MSFSPPRYLLAPLQGLTEAPVRCLFHRIGGVDGFVTPFVRISRRPCSPQAIYREMPELHPDSPARQLVPLTALQLLGSEPEPMAESALLAVELGAWAIDLNFGCPDNRVNRHGGGAVLSKNPPLIEKITAEVRRSVPSSIPVSVKIRLGWDSPDEVADIALAAERGGASWITVHARTRQQRYEGKADWEAVAKARQVVSVPVVANGDIVDRDSWQRCRQTTGCESFMIGRGALMRPELFAELSGKTAGPWTPVQRASFLLDYCEERKRWPISDWAALGRLKGMAVYLARGDDHLAELFAVLKLAESIAQAEEIVRRWVERRSA